MTPDQVARTTGTTSGRCGEDYRRMVCKREGVEFIPKVGGCGCDKCRRGLPEGTT